MSRRDLFGTSVAVSGDTVVVGAPGEDSNAATVNGDQGNNSAVGAGAAYVFVRSGTTWTQQAYLKASNTYGGGILGVSVAISGDTLVTGAEREAYRSLHRSFQTLCTTDCTDDTDEIHQTKSSWWVSAIRVIRG